MLARDDDILLELPYEERRAILEELVEKPVDLTPCTREREEAEPWLHSAEGVIAKQLAAPYRPGERTGMVKIKRVRTIDAVVCGWRPGKEEGTVGALILGLYNEDGDLRVVGHSSGLKAKEKRDLVKELAPYETGQRGAASPAAGARDATSSGSSCAPSSWSRSASTTSPPGASATGPSSTAGARTRTPRTAPSTSSTADMAVGLSSGRG